MIKTGPIQAVFFDLDGTLLDTALDLAFALNHVLAHHNRAPIDFAEFRYHIYGGSKTIIKAGFDIDETHADYETIRQAFLTAYREHLTEQTTLFPGMPNVLDVLDQRHIPWGIVTNKPDWLTQPLLKHFKLHHRCCCIISGDTVTPRKPHPAPLLAACRYTNCKPHQAVYVGDTLTDVQAANAALMHVIAVSYGYHPKNTSPDTWPADHIIESAYDMIKWLDEK